MDMFIFNNRVLIAILVIALVVFTIILIMLFGPSLFEVGAVDIPNLKEDSDETNIEKINIVYNDPSQYTRK